MFYRSLEDNIWLTCRERGAGEGQMDELIGRLVANVGVDKAAATTAVGIILQFLAKEGPADKVQQLIDKSTLESPFQIETCQQSASSCRLTIRPT